MTDQAALARAAASDDLIMEERRGAVAILTLNRPAARNALSRAMIATLHGAIDRIAQDESVSVVILAAAGPAFCAGHDFKELTVHRDDDDRGRAFFAETMRACAVMMQAIVHCPKPVIAAVHATATAAGCQLVATCDLAVAADSAAFAMPGVNIGLFCSTPMVALSRNVSRKQAMEMLLLGEMLDAGAARDYGLVNRVVPADHVMQEAMSMAETIASKSPLTVAIGKEAFYRQLELDLSGAYDYAADVMVRNMLARDAEEGINAFIEKRPPRWEGR
jgi:enoyl-CoA hydratase/carnithine racemase